MKKLKHILIAIASLTIAHTASAQLYINVGAGYGLAAQRQMVTWETTSTSSSQTDKGIYGSFGAGVMPQLAIGYNLNTNCGIEANLGYLLGSKIKAESNEQPGANWTIMTTEESWARSFRAGLGFRYTFGEGNMMPYMRSGIMFGFGNKLTMTMEETETLASVTTVVKMTEEFDGGTAIGFYGGLGMNFHITDMFGIFAEVGYIGQTWAPTHSLITEYTVDGQDQLGNMTTRDKETEYSHEVTISGTPSDSQPDQDLLWFYPMSSWGLNLGVHLYFGE